MLSPDKEYYLPKDAEEVAYKIVNLMEKSSPSHTRAYGGPNVGRFLKEYLELSSGLSYSAAGLWLFETNRFEPKFILQAINYIDSQHFFSSKGKIFELAQKRIEDIEKTYGRLMLRSRSRSSICLKDIPNLDYSSIRGIDYRHYPKDITEQYNINFNLLTNLTFGEGLHPTVGKQHHDGKFLGGTIAFVDPLS